MMQKGFFEKVYSFFRKHRQVVKAVFLLVAVLYFASLFVANLLYFKYDKQEFVLFPKINFGIDIVGGRQLTIAIDTSGVIDENVENVKEFTANFCKEKNADCVINSGNREKEGYFVGVKMYFKQKDGDKLVGSSKEADKITKEATKDLRNIFNQFGVKVVKNSFPELELEIIISKDAMAKIVADTTDKAITILKNRIDGVGVKEITVQRYGTDKIVILIPSGVDIDGIKNVVNTTAKLEFYLMDKQHIFYYKPKEFLKNHKLLPLYRSGSIGQQNQNETNGVFYLVEDKAVLSGESIASVQPNIDGINNAINFRMNANGAKKFGEITSNNRGRLLAIVLDGKVLMAPMINVAILNGSGSITGHFSADEVVNLSVLLRSGSLPANVSIVNEKQLGSIFDKNILSRVSNIVVCLIAVSMTMMFLRYRVVGLLTIVSLVLNFFFTFGIMSIFGFTLTLPGIAGFILMLGMATDANILIYEKMKDVARKGIKYKESVISNGFSRAIGTILDANITTIIAGIALFSFGGSFIKGFSITLIFGILCSIFTSVNITRMIIEFIYRKKNYINI